MVTANTILHAIERTLINAGGVTDDLSYVVHETDGAGDAGGVYFPYADIRPQDLRPQDGPPTEDPVRDDDGGRIGTITRIPWQMDVVVALHVDVDNPTYDAATLGDAIETALYRHDDDVRGDPLEDDAGDPLVEVTTVSVEAVDPDTDAGSNPAVQGWPTTVFVEYNRVVNSVEEYGPAPYVSAIVGPRPGEFHTGDDTGEVAFDPRDVYPRE